MISLQFISKWGNGVTGVKSGVICMHVTPLARVGVRVSMGGVMGGDIPIGIPPLTHPPLPRRANAKIPTLG
jgi:hypothetical protein